jgi:hypothetical protein
VKTILLSLLKIKISSMNTIIELLNGVGYKNTNTNRERSVRNLNLLLDSGIMKLRFIDSESYNAKENGRCFWIQLSNGKKVPTAYLVTLYGKTYFGHVMKKRLTTKWKSAENFDGTCEYSVHTEYYDNTYISIDDIQLRVASLLTIIREDKDFFAPKLFAAKGDCSCSKCHGVGIIPSFSYYANGICFDCGGSGINRDSLKSFINDAMKID